VRSALTIALPAVVAIALALMPTVHTVDPGARVALETTMALSAIVSICLVRANVECSRQPSEVLLLSALVLVSLTGFVYCAVPGLSSRVHVEAMGEARLGAELVVALTFMTAAFAPRRVIPQRGAWLAGCAIAASVVTVGLGVLLQLTVDPDALTDALEGGAMHTLALEVHIVSAALLTVTAVGFAVRFRHELHGSLIAGASLLLAGASLQYLATPAVATDWVTPREGLRLAAYALLLSAAYGRYAKSRRDETRAAINSERERIARDLHDGLAQDLACIAVQGQRLDSNVGPEHPLMVATRRALAASRGAIADLWASAAPSTEEALRLIANELEHRFEIQVDVRIDTDVPLTVDSDLEPRQRETVVGIAREAIVNAALHGTARHVDVLMLKRESALVLRVSDDGQGISETMRPGFGWRTMRARAAAMGGQLNAYQRAGGGTELELLVS
jgi:signal transduction histidine kinase